MKIVFDSVDKNFGLITALSNISFTVDQGEFVFIVGHSGAGKSTIIKLLLNQIKPSRGQITVDGTDLSLGTKNEIDLIRRQIGVIFQDYQLIMDKSIEENIALSLDIIKYPRSKISTKIDEVIKLVDLNSRRYLFPAQLSGGELQRAALARALAIEPKIILADEPTGNLDEKNKTTIIMTTHNQEIVDSLDRRRIEIKDGQIVKDFTPGTTPKAAPVKKNTSSTKNDTH